MIFLDLFISTKSHILIGCKNSMRSLGDRWVNILAEIVYNEKIHPDRYN